MKKPTKLAERLELVSVDELEADEQNARRHPEKNLAALKASLKEFGQQKPIVIDGKNVVVAGNGTLAAARELGIPQLWAIRTTLRGAKRTAYAIADNRIGDTSHFDSESLKSALEELAKAGGNLELAAGFTDDDLAALSEVAELEDDKADKAAIPDDVEPLTQVGETWRCGDHLILVGDVSKRIGELENSSFQCVVTSPPYYGMRDYGTAVWTGGDDPACDHAIKRQKDAQRPFDGGPIAHGDFYYQGRCERCGATAADSQLGLEASLDDHQTRLVKVFRAVRRVLRPDGVVWLNYGDSFASSADKGNAIKAKDLVGMPWRVAFALQRDGWYIRSEVIWSKPNPMPEPSNRNRPTHSHEHLFLLTSGRAYFYDAFAIREPSSRTPGRTRNRHSVWSFPTRPLSDAHFATFPERLVEPCILAGTSEKGRSAASGAPWRRRVEVKAGSRGDWSGHPRGQEDKTIGRTRAKPKGGWGDYNQVEAGWDPPAEDDAGETVPCRVLDPFGGAGTTMLVCEQAGRHCVSIELSNRYADIAIHRWENFTGKKAEIVQK